MSISEHYDNLHLEVSLPNEQARAELHGRRRITIHIAAGYAERAGEREMESQLARLARLLFAHRSAAFNKLNKEYLGGPTVERPPTPQDEQYRRAYESMSVSGRSHDGSLTATTLGLEQWSIEIEPGTISRIGSTGLAEAATQAANDLIDRIFAAIRDARHDAYAKHD